MEIMGRVARKQHGALYVGRGVLQYAPTRNNPIQNTPTATHLP